MIYFLSNIPEDAPEGSRWLVLLHDGRALHGWVDYEGQFRLGDTDEVLDVGIENLIVGCSQIKFTRRYASNED